MERCLSRADLLKDSEAFYLQMDEGSSEIGSYFECTRVNDTTFVIHENDRFDEHPFIYVKVYESIPLVVFSDTGCGGGNNRQSQSSNLKDFIETYPIPSNNDKPLNPRAANGEVYKKYMIICTHCHYDHIMGLQRFHKDNAVIVASEEGRSFIENDFPTHSLCRFLDVSVPHYTVTQWASDHHELQFDGMKIGIQVIHTPGHTPDELAWYDQHERQMYVGDSFYERVAKNKAYEQAILFPTEGDIVAYMRSLAKLLDFVEAQDSDNKSRKGPVMIGCGHVTSGVPAKEMLVAVRRLFIDILNDKVPIVHKEEKRGEEFVTWKENGDPRFSVSAPRRIMLDAKRSLDV